MSTAYGENKIHHSAVIYGAIHMREFTVDHLDDSRSRQRQMAANS